MPARLAPPASITTTPPAPFSTLTDALLAELLVTTLRHERAPLPGVASVIRAGPPVSPLLELVLALARVQG